ncbi:MAG: kelch repeat-containing protein [Myxococcota bacterium]
MRWTLLLALVLLSCQGTDQVTLALIHPRSLEPSDAFASLTVTVRRLSDLQVVEEGFVRGDTLQGPREAFDLSALEVGERYVLELEASAPVVCRDGRAIGRSLPFAHRNESYRIPVHVGCTDDFGLTASEVPTPRVAHSMAKLGDGTVLVAGGAETITFDGPEETFGIRVGEAPATTERYDPSTGEFIPGPTLIAPRALAGAVSLPSGAVGLLGGLTDMGPLCEDRVEILTPSSAALGERLRYPRCSPTAQYLPDRDSVGVFGSALTDGVVLVTNRGVDAEMMTANLGGRVREEVRGQTYRFRPAVVSLEDGARVLVVGGQVATLALSPAEIFTVDASCPDGCTTPIPVEDASRGLGETSAVYIPCAAGGPGSVYVFGGRSRPEMVDVPRDDVWCYRDDAGEAVLSGKLPAPRYSAVSVRIRGPEGPRALVVGGTAGTRDAPMRPYEDALLIDVDGCSCTTVDPAAMRTLPVPFAGSLVGHAVTVMDDGAVLVVGGVEIATGVEARATPEAAIMVPAF